MSDEQLEMKKLAESIAKEISVMATESKWATRFVWAAIIQGALISMLTGILVLGEFGVFLRTPVSSLISTTVPGIWIALGYFAYLVIGVVGMAVTALFYQYLEVNLKSPYTRHAKDLAWLHLVLSNVGIIGASWLVIYSGYVTGVATLSNSLGGLGRSMNEVAAIVHSQFLFPIAAFASLTILGIILGGLGYVLVYRERPKSQF
ncbi:MAG: hypothetical protein ABSF09_05515 [Candidatus Bathyarchaeia archaeon]